MLRRLAGANAAHGGAGLLLPTKWPHALRPVLKDTLAPDRFPILQKKLKLRGGLPTCTCCTNKRNSFKTYTLLCAFSTSPKPNDQKNIP